MKLGHKNRAKKMSPHVGSGSKFRNPSNQIHKEDEV
jgi:hypothetical protein